MCLHLTLSSLLHQRLSANRVYLCQASLQSSIYAQMYMLHSMGNSFGQKCDPLIFDMLYLHKYSHSFSQFPWLIIQIFSTNVGHRFRASQLLCAGILANLWRTGLLQVQKKGRTRNCKYLHQFLAVSLDVADVYVLKTLLIQIYFLKLW